MGKIHEAIFESKAYLLEACGLALLLSAAIWQVKFTDWFSETKLEWQFTISQESDFALLAALGNLAEVTALKDGPQKFEQAHKVNLDTAKAIRDTIRERKRRTGEFADQAKRFSIVRFGLFFVGTILLIGGKYLQFLSEPPNKAPEPTPTSVMPLANEGEAE